jgi:hypothetical protein
MGNSSWSFLSFLSSLATKEVRTGLFVYVVTMHLLVFITTYHWSHAAGSCSVNNEHLSHLPPVLPPHLQEQMVAKAAEAMVAATR